MREKAQSFLNDQKKREVLNRGNKKKKQIFNTAFLCYFGKSRFLLIIEHFFAIFSQLSIFDNIIQILKSNTRKSTNIQFLYSFFFLILSLFYASFQFFTLFSFLSYLSFFRVIYSLFCLYWALFSRFCYLPGRFSVILRPNYWKRVDLVFLYLLPRSKVVWWLGWTLEVDFIHSIFPT